MIKYRETDKAKVIQRACREAMKCKLLHDIRADIEVCELEWRDVMEYINELHDLLNGFVKTYKSQTNDKEIKEFMVWDWIQRSLF